jgi:hypothetical protein
MKFFVYKMYHSILNKKLVYALKLNREHSMLVSYQYTYPGSFSLINILVHYQYTYPGPLSISRQTVLDWHGWGTVDSKSSLPFVGV